MSNNKTSLPLYVKTAASLRGDITRGTFASGERISHRLISEKYGVSKKTAADAMEILQSEGLVISRPRVGTFINSQLWLPVVDKTPPAWDDLIRQSSTVPSNEKIYSVYKLISSSPQNNLGGTAISKGFQLHKPVKIAMERALNRMDDLYTVNIMGMPSLRKSIAAHVSRSGIHCSYEDILITSGPMEALSIVVMSLLRHGLKLFIEETSILGSPTFARYTGADIRRVRTDDDGMSADDLIEQSRKCKSCGVVCVSPTNQYPTGATLSKQRRDLIMSTCVSKNMPIIEYDMLRDINHTSTPRPFKSFDKNDLVIYIGSLVSSYQNMKIGWIIAPPQIMKHITDTKTQYEINTNTVVQVIADEMLASGAYTDYLEEYMPHFNERLSLCRMLFEKYFTGTASWSGNPLGFYQWLQFKSDINTYEILKNLQNTFVHSGYFFNPADTNRIYINPMGDTAENLEAGLKEIMHTTRKLYNSHV